MEIRLEIGGIMNIFSLVHFDLNWSNFLTSNLKKLMELRKNLVTLRITEFNRLII